MLSEKAIETRQKHDAWSGIEVTDQFERFHQCNDIFARAFWDESIRTKKTDAFFASYRMEAAPR